MKKTDETITFFKNFATSLNIPKRTTEKLFTILNPLLEADPYCLTQYEVSFKIFPNKKINPKIRFLNMDADGYSCRNQKFFNKRAELFCDIIYQQNRNKFTNKILNAFQEISPWPMDLYFGCDIYNKNISFCFWLIFGGVRGAQGPNFWSYDFAKIMNSLFTNLNLKGPKLKKSFPVLNFGLDVEEGELFYKLYYLMKTKNIKKKNFSEIARSLNKGLNKHNYFYFFSELYDEGARLRKEKLFLEFLQKINNHDKQLISSILDGLLRVREVNFNKKYLLEKLRLIGGRTSLVSIEKNGCLTFYIRPI